MKKIKQIKNHSPKTKTQSVSAPKSVSLKEKENKTSDTTQQIKEPMNAFYSEYFKWILIIVFCIILFLMFVYFIGHSIYAYGERGRQIEYYKSQMLSFCEISKIYNEELYPNMYPCERWLLK